MIEPADLQQVCCMTFLCMPNALPDTSFGSPSTVAAFAVSHDIVQVVSVYGVH